MKPSLWLLAFVFAIPLNMLAQQAQPLVKDPKAKAIMDKVAARYNSYKNLKAEFTFRLMNKKEKINEKHDGTVYLSGGKYRMEMMGAETMCDGKTIWTLLKESQEVNVSSVDPTDKSIFNQPARIFKMYDEGFKYKLNGEKTEEGKVYYDIDLYPENLDIDLFGKGKKKNNLMRIKLKIDKAQMQLSSVEYFGKDGVDYSIRIRKFQTNLSMPESTFVFNKAQFPGYEINDLRD